MKEEQNLPVWEELKRSERGYCLHQHLYLKSSLSIKILLAFLTFHFGLYFYIKGSSFWLVFANCLQSKLLGRIGLDY